MSVYRVVGRVVRRVLSSALALAATLTFAQAGVTVVVPYPVGGPSDHVARTLAPELQKQLGQAVLVENVPGASGSIGLHKLLAAAPNGTTVALASPMELVLAPMALLAVRHAPEDLKPAGLIVSTTLVLIARKDLPGDTLDQLLAQQRGAGARPLSFGSAGIGTLHHLAAEVFARDAGVAITHVPYAGVAPLATDLMSGQLDLAFVPLAGNVPGLIREGRLKAYGVTSRQPHPPYPALPPLAVGRFERLSFDLWAGLFVARDVPDAALERLNVALRTALRHPELRRVLESTGNVIAPPLDGSAAQAFYAEEIARYRAIAREAGLQRQ